MKLTPRRTGYWLWRSRWTPFVPEGLAGTGAVLPTATGVLGVAMPLSGAAALQSFVFGSLGVAFPLAGQAATVVSATSSLSGGTGPMAIDLAGTAGVQSSATGNLQTNDISAYAQARATGAGSLTTRMPITADAIARAIAAGTPTVLVPLGATAAVVETATGAILKATGIAGDAKDVATAHGVVSMLQSASGSAASRAAAVAALTVGASLQGAAAVVGTAHGALGIGIDLDADAMSRASAGATTGVSTALGGEATVAPQATGRLSQAEVVAGEICYAVNISTNAATTLTNFNFERLLKAHGSTYGIKSGKMYKIGGTADPGPVSINATVRFSASHYGSIGQKRLDTVFFYSRETTGLSITPVYDEIAGITYSTPALNKEGMRTSRAYVGRGNAWHTLGLIVSNQNGGKFDIGAFSPVVAPLSRISR